MKNIEDFSGKNVKGTVLKQKRNKTERATRASRRRREEIEKWNHMMALRFQI